MRLINVRFGDESRFFWDKRAATLEVQTTQPIRDHGEMGFSGTNGDPDFAALIIKMEATPYYQTLFTEAFGDDMISEARMQLALAQFIRSIQSFDSKFEIGLSQAGGNINAPFPNFSDLENQGENLFHQPPQVGNGGIRASGNDVYTNERWSDPFEADGTLALIGAGILGDVNQDGLVNFLDVAPFILVLTSNGFQEEADTNQDGAVTFLDIFAFINLLASQ